MDQSPGAEARASGVEGSGSGPVSIASAGKAGASVASRFLGTKRIGP